MCKKITADVAQQITNELGLGTSSLVEELVDEVSPVFGESCARRCEVPELTPTMQAIDAIHAKALLKG